MILLKIWRKIGPMVFVWVFKIHGGTSYQNQIWVPPAHPGLHAHVYFNRPYCHVIYKHSNYLKNELKVINKPYSDDNNYLLWRF